MKKDLTKTKIIDRKQLTKLIQLYRKEGKKVGCISGSFDLLTASHYKALYECSKFCDVLIVLLNSDTSVRMYKGPGKPIVGESERSYLLAQSPHAAHVVIFDELTPLAILENIRPHVFFNSSEWGSDCIEKETVEKYGGRIHAFTVAAEEGWVASSSALVQKIIASEIVKARKAVFLDRDGVINDDGKGYIYKWEDFKLLPNVITSLRKLEKAGYLLFIITNQSGIGRGYYTEKDVQKLHKKLAAHLREHGITITGIYYCPHLPEDGCICRKPSPGMLLQAAKEHNLNLSKSWFIGDSGSDIDAGRYANTRTILISSAKEIEGRFKPNVAVTNIKQAVVVILKK